MAVLGSALSTAAGAIPAVEQAGGGERAPLLKSHLRPVEKGKETMFDVFIKRGNFGG